MTCPMRLTPTAKRRPPPASSKWTLTGLPPLSLHTCTHNAGVSAAFEHRHRPLWLCRCAAQGEAGKAHGDVSVGIDIIVMSCALSCLSVHGWMCTTGVIVPWLHGRSFATAPPSSPPLAEPPPDASASHDAQKALRTFASHKGHQGLTERSGAQRWLPYGG